MELQVKVDEADVGQVKEGQRAEFTVDAYTERRYPAHITRVSFGATTTDNVVTYLTTLKVANDDLSLRPGMTATAEIVTLEKDDVLLVPNAALRFTPPTARAQASSSIMSSLMPRPPRQEKTVKVKDEAPVSEPCGSSRRGRSAGFSERAHRCHQRPLHRDRFGQCHERHGGDHRSDERRQVNAMTQTAPPLIELAGITKTYGDGQAAFQALRGVDLHRSGRVRRRDGAERLRQIDGDEHPRLPRHPNLGRYRFQGVPVETMDRNQRALLRRHFLGFVFQGFNLLGRTSALENVELPLLYRGEGWRPATPPPARPLAQVGSTAGVAHPAELSGGSSNAWRRPRNRHQSDRAAGRRADRQPDTVRSREIMDLLTELNRQAGITVLMVTHEPDMAAYAHRQVHFVDGRVDRDSRAPALEAGA